MFVTIHSSQGAPAASWLAAIPATVPTAIPTSIFWCCFIRVPLQASRAA